MSEPHTIHLPSETITAAVQEYLNRTYFKNPMKVVGLAQSAAPEDKGQYKVSVELLPRAQKEPKPKRERKAKTGLGSNPLVNGKEWEERAEGRSEQ